MITGLYMPLMLPGCGAFVSTNFLEKLGNLIEDNYPELKLVVDEILIFGRVDNVMLTNDLPKIIKKKSLLWS